MKQLAVVCTACMERAVHEVAVILLDLDALQAPDGSIEDDAAAWTRAVYVASSLACPSCGAVDEHTVEPASGRSLEVDDVTVHAGRAALSDGTTLRTPSAGIRILEKRALAKPKHAKGWRALGNFAMRADRSAEALDAWRRGASIDGELECALAVAVDAVARAHPEAAQLVARALERLVYAEAQRRALQSAQVAELVRQLETGLVVHLDGERLETKSIRDWSRFGEHLATARAITAVVS